MAEIRLEHGWRGYVVIDDLPDIKARNAAVRQLTGEGYNPTAGGYKGHYRVKAWKGDQPYMVRESFNLRDGSVTITPVYKVSGKQEFIDGRSFKL